LFGARKLAFYVAELRIVLGNAAKDALGLGKLAFPFEVQGEIVQIVHQGI
jgi:hypothetical protein